MSPTVTILLSILHGKLIMLAIILASEKKQVSYHESVISNVPDKIYEIFDIQAAHRYDEWQ